MRLKIAVSVVQFRPWAPSPLAVPHQPHSARQSGQIYAVTLIHFGGFVFISQKCMDTLGVWRTRRPRKSYPHRQASHFAISKAAPKPRPYKLSDGSADILVEPNGSRMTLPLAIGGRERTIGFGTYPATSLADARMKRGSARSLPAKTAVWTRPLSAGKAKRAKRSRPAARLDLSLRKCSPTRGRRRSSRTQTWAEPLGCSKTLPRLWPPGRSPKSPRRKNRQSFGGIEKSDRRKSAPSINPEIGGPSAARESSSSANPPRPAGQRRFDGAMIGHPAERRRSPKRK